ncbi:MAG TPA: selenocysteine-specific translation elongation factor [Candidatus Methylomirabilis sp.]|nr:selenocysteine-specific translation elongation factor [Candidatus Methylomirabilis sp.]
MKHIIIGTAGHIDHGKTSLVKALTGIDTDRLKEEKERGISIELGFAHLTLADGLRLGIVDVPGHERFVKTMLAGVGGIDLVILVIAADEGIMPQTREHLHICRLLQIPRGLVALTKRDLVDPDWLEMVAEEIRIFLKGTFLEGAPILPVSATTGAGLEELKAALGALAAEAEPKRVEGIFRLPIDRVFTMRGFGTVITGTLLAGSVKVGDEVVVLPEGARSRVRRLQVHGETVEQAFAGQRTAVNLPGVEVSSIARGSLLCFPGAFRPSTAMDASLTLLADAPRPLKNRSRVRLHLGTSELLARVILLDREELDRGQSATVHLRLESPGAALPQDRFVIRSYSPAVTIGGGIILDPAPPERRRKRQEILEHLRVLEQGSPSDRLERLLLQAGAPMSPEALRGASDLEPELLREALTRLLAERRIVAVGGREEEAYLHHQAYDGLTREILARLGEFHRQQPLKDGLAKEELRSKLPGKIGPALFGRLLTDLQAAGLVAQERDKVRLASHTPRLSEAEEATKAKLEALYREAGFQPPGQEAALQQAAGDRRMAQAVFFRLVDDGTLVRIKDDLYLHREHVERAKDLLLTHLKTHGSIGVPTFKDLLGVSRKYAIPFLEYFDQVRVTRRQGDERLPYR